jgi:hypothetical protein
MRRRLATAPLRIRRRTASKRNETRRSSMAYTCPAEGHRVASEQRAQAGFLAEHTRRPW